MLTLFLGEAAAKESGAAKIKPQPNMHCVALRITSDEVTLA